MPLSGWLIITVITVVCCGLMLGRLAVTQTQSWWHVAVAHGRWAACATGLSIGVVWATYGLFSWPFCVPVWLWSAAVITKLGECRLAHIPMRGQQKVVREQLPLHIEKQVKPFKAGRGWDRQIHEHKHAYDSAGVAVGPFSVIAPPGESANLNAQPVADQFADVLGGEWTAQASHNSRRITVERIPEFTGDTYHTLINDPPKTLTDTVTHYPDLTIPRGVDCRGNIVSWKPDSERPHVLICGKSGNGKTSALATMLTEAIAGGMQVIICDYNYSTSFDNFGDLPNVIGYANTKDDINRAIAHVKDVADNRAAEAQRQPKGWIPRWAPILLIVDEIPTMRREAKPAWTMLINILEKGRKTRVHCALASQQVTKSVITPELRRACPGIEQYGYLDRDEGALLWADGGVAMKIIGAGRGLIGRVGDQSPAQVTGFYTPGTRIDRPLIGADKRCYDALITQIHESVPELYDRLAVFAGGPSDTPVAGMAGEALHAREATASDIPVAGAQSPVAGADIATTSGDASDTPVADHVVDPVAADILSDISSSLLEHLDTVASAIIASGRTKQPHSKVVEVLQEYLASRSVSAAAAVAQINRSAVRLIIGEAEQTPTWVGWSSGPPGNCAPDDSSAR